MFWYVPSGHYVLNLSSKVQRSIAERLKDLSAEEPGHGTLSWNNILLDEYSSCVKCYRSNGPPQEMGGQVPNRGLLTLDYVSHHVPPQGAVAVELKRLIALLKEEVREGNAGIQVFLLLRPNSANIFANYDPHSSAFKCPPEGRGDGGEGDAELSLLLLR
jgi:hypothetical protein